MKTIFIMTNTGHTYDFHDVEEVKNMNGTLVLTYTGKRTGTKNTAYFHNVAGYVEKGQE